MHRSSSVFLLLLDLLWHRLFVAPWRAISAISRQVDRCWNRLEFPFSVVRHYKTIKDQTVPSHRKDPKQALRVLSCCQNCQLPRESIVSSSPFETLSPESLRPVGPGGIHGNVVLVYLTTFRLWITLWKVGKVPCISSCPSLYLIEADKVVDGLSNNLSLKKTQSRVNTMSLWCSEHPDPSFKARPCRRECACRQGKEDGP